MRRRASYKLLDADVAVQDALESCARTIQDLQRRIASDTTAQTVGSYRYYRTQRDLSAILYAIDRVGLMTPPPEPPPIPPPKRLPKPVRPSVSGPADPSAEYDPSPVETAPPPTAPEKASK